MNEADSRSARLEDSASLGTRPRAARGWPGAHGKSGATLAAAATAKLTPKPTPLVPTHAGSVQLAGTGSLERKSSSPVFFEPRLPPASGPCDLPYVRARCSSYGRDPPRRGRRHQSVDHGAYHLAERWFWFGWSRERGRAGRQRLRRPRDIHLSRRCVVTWLQLTAARLPPDTGVAAPEQ
jgi:hypothetical protein